MECERKESSEAKETEGQIETKCDTWPGLVLGSKKIFSLSIDIIHIAIMNSICTVGKKNQLRVETGLDLRSVLIS